MALDGRKISVMDYSIQNNSTFECGVTEKRISLTYNGWTEEEALAKVTEMLQPLKQTRLIELAGLTEEEADERLLALIQEDEEIFKSQVQEPVVEPVEEEIEPVEEVIEPVQEEL